MIPVKKPSGIHKKSWLSLSPSEKAVRMRALEALRLIRSGKSFTNAAKSTGISPKTARNQLRGTLFKRKRRWRARAQDRIERALVIYERGRLKTVILRDSETASLVGRYLNDAKKVLETGDRSLLKKYRKVTIKDSKGKKHKLETRIDKIKAIELAREEIEFSDIYAQ